MKLPLLVTMPFLVVTLTSIGANISSPRYIVGPLPFKAGPCGQTTPTPTAHHRTVSMGRPSTRPQSDLAHLTSQVIALKKAIEGQRADLTALHDHITKPWCCCLRPKIKTA